MRFRGPKYAPQKNGLQNGKMRHEKLARNLSLSWSHARQVRRGEQKVKPKTGPVWGADFCKKGPKNDPIWAPLFAGPESGWALNLERNSQKNASAQCRWALSVTLPAFHPCPGLVILSASSLQRSSANMCLHWQRGPASCLNTSNNLQLWRAVLRDLFRVTYASKMGQEKPPLEPPSPWLKNA